ncbi:hypothetical protein QOT17_018573 [Balamuthia mandrillaris]
MTLLDNSAFSSFVNPSLIKQFWLKTTHTQQDVILKDDSSASLSSFTQVICGHDRISIDLFGIPVWFTGPKPSTLDNKNIASSDNYINTNLQKAIVNHIKELLEENSCIPQASVFYSGSLALLYQPAVQIMVFFPMPIKLVSFCSSVQCHKMSGTLPQSGTTPSSDAQSGPLSSGAIPPASGTPSPITTFTTLPTDRLDAIDQALSELRTSQADHDRLLVKQTSDISSLSDHINHIDAKLETFADELSNDIKQANEHNEVALVALNKAISQLQTLFKAQLADKDNGLSSGSSSSLLSKEEEEKEKEKRKPALNLTTHHQDLQQHTAKHNTGDSLGDIQLTQSLLTTETLPTFHGKPKEDPNIFLTSFNHYATAAG